MKNKNLKILILLFFTITTVNSQHLYKEKFENCDLTHFTLESVNIIAKKNKKELLDVLTSTIPKSIKKKLTGDLRFQIIIFKGGTSCLLSYENDTNYSSKKIKITNLKTIIDSELIWENKFKNVCSLIEIKFSNGNASLKRYGIGGKKGGIHELKK